MNEQTFLTVKEVAELLQVTRLTVYMWIRKHIIPYYKLNSRIRFKRDEFFNWLNENKKA